MYFIQRLKGGYIVIMGPLLKPFLEVSRTQQRRRIHALLQIDNNSLYSANNVVSKPTRPLCSLPTAYALIPNDVRHEISQFFNNLEHFNDVENGALVDKRSIILTDKDVQIEVQAQSSFSSSSSSYVETIQTQSIVSCPTDLRAFVAHWAIKNKVPQSVVNDL